MPTGKATSLLPLVLSPIVVLMIRLRPTSASLATVRSLFNSRFCSSRMGRYATNSTAPTAETQSQQVCSLAVHLQLSAVMAVMQQRRRLLGALQEVCSCNVDSLQLIECAGYDSPVRVGRQHMCVGSSFKRHHGFKSAALQSAQEAHL